MKTHIPVRAAAAVGLLGTGGSVLAFQHPAGADAAVPCSDGSQTSHIDIQTFSIPESGRHGVRTWWTSNPDHCLQQAWTDCTNGSKWTTITGDWRGLTGFENRSVANCPPELPTRGAYGVSIKD